MREERVYDWGIKAGFRVTQFVLLSKNNSFPTHTLTHLHKRPFCHPPDPPNASVAGPAAAAAEPCPGEGANASGVLQKKNSGNAKNRPTDRTHGCKEQKMSQQME